ncbi:MAG: hypothetical protein P8014_17905 [Acidihalobacter sp.]|uniref:hypothetical protein n=1 Tax=Acidihalobacter sp. TaxID=1872108 RepID=UPI00307E6156
MMKKTIGLLLVLSLVAGGWLYKQTPAHAYTLKNRVLHFLKADNSISIPFAQLSGSMTEKEILKHYPKLGLDCGYEPSSLGERSCYASVKSINEVDAWFVVFFFEKGGLRQVKADIMPGAHKAMMHWLTDKFGSGMTVSHGKASETLVHWIELNGAIAMNKEAYGNEPSQVVWVSKERILQKIMKGRLS